MDFLSTQSYISDPGPIPFDKTLPEQCDGPTSHSNDVLFPVLLQFDARIFLATNKLNGKGPAKPH